MTDTPSAPGESRLALTAGIACYVIWGAMPLVFQTLASLGAGYLEVLAQRTIWALPMAAVFVAAGRQWRQVAGVLRNPRTLAWLALSAALIAVNWGVFIWAALHHRVLETAFGYYITPLVSLAAGALIFHERLSGAGKVAVALATAGVALQAAALGQLPLVSLAVAFSFGFYGVVRKRVEADAQSGLFVECLILSIAALPYVVWLQGQGLGHFGDNPTITAWMIGSGVVTATPLVLFAWATRRMPLQAMGFMQFVSPTLTFMVGTSQGEAFTPLRAASFGLIWIGAAIFVWSAWRRARLAAYARAA